MAKVFFDVPIKNKRRNLQTNYWNEQNDYASGNLLDYEYFPKHHKINAIDLSNRIKLEDLDLKQQINFTAKSILMIILMHLF